MRCVEQEIETFDQKLAQNDFSRRSPYPVIFFFIKLQPLKKWSTTNYAPFALDREPGSLTDTFRPS